MPISASALGAGTTISFAVTGPDFTVRFDSVPASGKLEIDRTAAADVSAQAVGAREDSRDAMVVLPRELRFRNNGASIGSYRIMIPGSVEHVRVVVGGRTLFDDPPRHAEIALAWATRK
jgi:hypothetical protein